jgi:hypothetical protein
LKPKLHIVCLDAPSPPDYGGAIDMFYKIKELSKSWTIILHYFNYKPGRNTAVIEGYCESVFSYQRKPGFRGFSFITPYIIHSRMNNELSDRLNNDDYPILLEGIHCAGILPSLSKKRKVVIRMHNDEALYYNRLASSESNLFRKAYFRLESILLKKYQQQLDASIPLACVSTTDMDILKNRYRKTNCYFIPSFTPWQTLSGKEGTGNYCLYHGNLEVAENKRMAEWLIRKVIPFSRSQFLIAGKGCGALSARYNRSNLRFIDHPSDAELNELIANAQVNILPSLNSTGLKLKLLHALFSGRHCITNNAGIEGTSFLHGVEIANSADEYLAAIERLMPQPFTDEHRERRKLLAEVYNNQLNAAKLNALLY